MVAAALLAFVVLYNLTNINITERAREIATLKVLGFTSREVDAYIFRETILLSVIGAAIGLVLGVFMEGFVITTAEVDQVMFGRDIHAASFAIAFALTMVFSGIVDILCGVVFFVYPAMLAVFLAVFVIMRGVSLIMYGWRADSVLM